MTFLKYWPELGAMFTLRKINAYLKKKKKETPPVFPSEKKKKGKLKTKERLHLCTCLCSSNLAWQWREEAGDLRAGRNKWK